MVRFFIALALLGLFVSSSARAQAVATPNDAEIAWTIFSNACIHNADNLRDWAADKKYLLDLGKSQPDMLEKSGGVFAYPLKVRLVDAWSVTNSTILLAGFADGGCSVTTDAYIPPENIQDILKSLIRSARQSGGKPGGISMQIDEGKNAAYFALPMDSSDRSMKHYVVARTYANRTKTSIRTIFYYLMTDQALKL